MRWPSAAASASTARSSAAASSTASATLGVAPLPDEAGAADAGGTDHDRVLVRTSGGPAVVRVAAREDVVIAEAVVDALG